ncbi:hypothetical protein SAMN05443287_10491 [Micromonospora phaseoli]|uniref:Uncharacterized protein n=1 Tax=Micromonospora phaseoli TaxID=1144548 RepID=A0A1H6Y799_9ACTN|nr:hypothetical protein [Micromonospora phaseoli]PZW00064.1 hypothetical protein CLV64_10390 [Micromonospora phaseoli]GIJ79574.1 hypothetical protein Xph01_40060 [Micromonospora phaseoli]SEJ37131.1 hypothetical protein SAMN05443287_10491 [Micromonospora phaseoli]
MRDLLDLLAGVPVARDQLDDTELDLIDRARQAGATWAQVADALGLGSRQAAEQRSQRLAAVRRARRSAADRHWPAEIAALRELLGELRRWIDADRRWEGRFPRATLADRTTTLALDAEPGGLYDLARRICVDLAEAGPDLPTPVRAIARDLAQILSTPR